MVMIKCMINGTLFGKRVASDKDAHSLHSLEALQRTHGLIVCVPRGTGQSFPHHEITI